MKAINVSELKSTSWTHDERQAIAALSRGLTVYGRDIEV
jgi:hypothetical protein